VSTSTYDKLEVTETPTGWQIDGFVRGETQARLVFTRRGEQLEMLCMTEELACAELSAIEALNDWELVSAHLVRFPAGSHAGPGPEAEPDRRPAARGRT